MSDESIDEIGIDDVANINLDDVYQHDKELDIIAKELCLYKTQQTLNKAKEGLAEVQQRNEKIKYIHDIRGAVLNMMDKDGNVDITNNKQLQEKLKVAKEQLGVEVNPDKLKYTAQETIILRDTLDHAAEDLTMENKTQNNKIGALQNQGHQFFLMAKEIMTTLHKTKSTISANLR